MKKEEILEASRKENKNKDLAELEIFRDAGNLAGRVGATVCCVVSILASVLAEMMLYSPWLIYFSIIGTNWLVRGVRCKRKSDLVVAVSFLLLACLTLVGLVIRLLGAGA